LLSDEQRTDIVTWLQDNISIGLEASEIVATGKMLDYYIGCWGAPQETATLADDSSLSVWRGDGYLFVIVDYGEFRAAAVH
jgi:hypothetical protein